MKRGSILFVVLGCIGLVGCAGTVEEEAVDSSGGNGSGTEINSTSGTSATPLGFGATCAFKADCESDICVLSPSTGSKVCTIQCAANSATCPQGWGCEESLEYQTTVCRPAATLSLCDTCTDHAQCGGLADRCVLLGTESVCATDCASAGDAACEAGFVCSEMFDGTDVSFRQCVPASGSCTPIVTETPDDFDGDGVEDILDNCATIPNADQTDTDIDNIGDDCDNCISASNNDQTDSNNDGVGDACSDDCANDNGGCGDPRFMRCNDTPGAPPTCEDINECESNNGGCGNAQYVGCFNVTNGPAQCQDVNECESNNGGCGDAQFVTCANNYGATPSCIDIDECLEANGGCGDAQFVTCNNIFGSTAECIDINECDNNNGGCHGHTACCINNFASTHSCVHHANNCN